MNKAILKQHLRWLEKNAPGITEAYKAKYGGLGAADKPPVTEQKTGWLDKLFGLAQAYTTFKTQKDILKAQTERMKRGQPPLNTSQYGMPPIRIETGLTPTARADSKKMMIYGGGAVLLLGALFVMSRPRSRR